MLIDDQTSNGKNFLGHQRYFRPFLSVAIAFALLASTVAIGVVVKSPPASALSSGTVSGTVYQDYNGDGRISGASRPVPADIGIAGVAVRAYESTGALVGQATSSSTGTYSIAVTNAATTDVRIEFDTPTGYYPSPTDINYPDPWPTTGATKSTRPGPIHFATESSSNVNYALVNEIVKATDEIAAVQMQKGGGACFATDSTLWKTTEALVTPGALDYLGRKNEVSCWSVQGAHRASRGLCVHYFWCWRFDERLSD